MMDFDKGQGLITAVIQHAGNRQVLMVGHMNREAYEKTLAEGRVTFFSRSRNQLWTKGETSGNYLKVVRMQVDCDQDALLIEVLPDGPTCHTGSFSCFGAQEDKGFLYDLEMIQAKRILESDAEKSYTHKIFGKGPKKLAQKVGEEAVELALEAKNGKDEDFLNEAADLMYHFLLLLKSRSFALQDVERILKNRHEQKG